MTNERIAISDDRIDAFIDYFMNDYPVDSLIDDLNAIEYDVIDFIDALFDDDFAILIESNENAESLFFEFIDRMNDDSRNYFNRAMIRAITRAIANSALTRI